MTQAVVKSQMQAVAKSQTQAVAQNQTQAVLKSQTQAVAKSEIDKSDTDCGVDTDQVECRVSGPYRALVT